MYVIYCIIFLTGAVIGSFLNVCIYRLPEKQSIIFPGSHCFACGHPLNALDLVPVFSYVFLKGKCRYCGSKLSLQYPLIEAAAGFLAVLSAVCCGFSVQAVLAFAFCSGLLVVFIIDKRTMLIPDEMTLFLIAVAVGYRLVNWNGITDLPDIVFGLLIGSGLLLLLYIFGLFILNKEVIGLGDIKLFVSVGILLGWKGTTVTLYLAVISGAVVAIFLLLRIRDKTKRRMPFGPFIASGAMLSLYFGDNLIHLYLKLLGL